MEAELVAAVLTVKEAVVVFCSNMMVELGFEEGFSRVPLYLDNTSALHVAGNRTYSPRATYTALLFFRLRASGGGQVDHPLREHPKSTFRLGHQKSRKASLLSPHQGQQRLRGLTHN